MTDSTKNTESNTNQIPSPTMEKDTNVDDSHLDSYGYSKVSETGEAISEETKIETPVEEKVKDSTGYEAPKEEKKPVEETKDNTGYNTPVEEDKKEDEKPVEGAEKEFEEVLKELPETINKEVLSKFALDNKMSKEQVEAYVNLVKSEEAERIEQEKAQIIKTRTQWTNELFTDPTFGKDSKETFDKSIHEVNKVLDNHMPNMKKALTDKGIMLPPYLMKDLLGFSRLLNPKTDLEVGEPSKVEEEKSFLETFYK